MKNAGEKAMALVDGQLAPAEVPDLVQELARSPGLVAELQAYLATAGSRIAEPFEAKCSEPVPAWLLDTITRGPAAGSRSVPQSKRGRALLDRLKGSYRVPAWSLAAGPALTAVLVALAVWLVMPTPSQGGLIEANLTVGLERTESGKDAALVALRPLLSFKSKDAAWCRQYEVRYGTKQVSHGLACRNDAGRWEVVASTSPRLVGLMPAGSEPRKAIDDRVTSMMSDQPLSKADEAARMSKGWPQL